MTEPSAEPTAEGSAEPTPGATPTPAIVEPTPEQIAERARRADRATRSALAGVLGLEALVTLLVPRAIAFTDGGLGVTRTVLLLTLAGLLLIGAGTVRSRFGIGVGSGLQVLFFLTGVLLVPMFVIGAIFAAIWGRLLWLRHELVGTPGWPAMLYC